MSLKPCPECGHNYSNKAKNCPQCASPNDDYESTSDKMFSGVNALILLGALFGGVYFFGNPVLNYNWRLLMHYLSQLNHSSY